VEGRVYVSKLIDALKHDIQGLCQSPRWITDNYLIC
jgi:hypothetical protein